MQTVKPKSHRRTIIAVIILVAIIGGGVGAYFLRTSVSSGTADFGVSVLVGNPDRPSGTWQKVDQTTGIMLNGTSKSFVVVVNATGGFNEFVNLSLSGTITGLTFHFNQTTVRPVTGGYYSTGLSLTAAPGVSTRKDPYSINVTGTSGSVKHSATFPLRIRSTTLFLDPATVSIVNGQTFKVAVKVGNIYDFYAFQFTIAYNSSLVNATDISIGSEFQPVNGGFIAEQNINNTIGLVSLAATMTGPCYISAACVNVQGPQEYIIANVTFVSSANVAFKGNTALTLGQDILNAASGDALIANLPHYTIPGSVSVTIVQGPDPTIIKAGLDPWYGPLILGVAVAVLLTVGSGVRVFRRPRKHP